MEDETVQGTNDDALGSKLSCINAGYLEDGFSQVFLKRAPKRPPIINRGTYCRTVGIDKIVHRFIQHYEKCQIVSLGAGSDSRYFLLKSKGLQPHLYVEVDFKDVTMKKALTVYKNKKTNSMLENIVVENQGSEIRSKDYWLIPGDLREFDTQLLPNLISKGLDTRYQQCYLMYSLPTLFVSECCLIYLDSSISNQIIASITSQFNEPFLICYEQILPSDAFGRVMLQNLKYRGIELPGIYDFPTLESHNERFLSLNWKFVQSIDINTLWKTYIDENEKQRVQKLELFDELEEWILLNDHYCIVVASKSDTYQLWYTD
ncbi:S-adenosyl-L-methionine-dependent methyltransferase [Globomyces pollinis-pini]|nr:S-adenosyl-L-methionine-dependent methyltransferase [Globomyces pollinis-pini]